MMILLMLLSLSISLIMFCSKSFPLKGCINQVGEASGQNHLPHRLSPNRLLEEREYLYEKHQQYHHQLLDDDE